MTPESLRQAAEQGHADAQLKLGIACLTGDGMPAQDVVQGREWLGRAADNGQVEAARFLGLILLRGMDVVPEPERGEALLAQAAEAGDLEATWWLACYRAGDRSAAPRLAEARPLLERAAAAGHPRAMTHLAYSLDGVLGPGSPVHEGTLEAGHWLLKAARAGDGGALLALAEWCHTGRGLPRDAGRARALAEAAERRGWEIAGEYARGLPDPVGAAGANAFPAPAELSLANDGTLPAPRLEARSWSPRVLFMHDLLTTFECAEVANAAREHLMPSFIVDQDGQHSMNDIRTSHEFRLRPAFRNLVIDTIERRMADWSHYPMAHGELPLVLRYERSQSFEQHFDYFIPERFGRGEGPMAEGGQRVATQLVYLNEDFEGGETRFDRADLVVTPRRGLCMMFHNVGPDHNVDPLTRHTGVAVNRGVKWLLSRWIRELPADQLAADHVRDRYLGED
ncbi:MAG: 2OG-Fe(II) oxygenase [Xanthomonadales bacterium]|jgi:prolyl 4-hydroxylase|nr:2OG-Fe(II) oxygenase [Xanthomonadales bacterium]